MLLFAAETEKFRGIMIYGEEELQKAAFLELGREFGLHELQRFAVGLPRILGELLTAHRRKKLLHQLKQEFPGGRVELLLARSSIS